MTETKDAASDGPASPHRNRGRPEERDGDGFRLETPGLTATFWGAVGAFVLAFWVTPYLPLIDYHQHVAIAAIMERIFAGSAEEQALYEVNLVTYNGGFHVLTAIVAHFIPAEQAGRAIMSLYPVLFGYATLALVREAGRPRWYALLALPITYSRGMAWGFANWNLTFPVALLGIAYFLRYARGDQRSLVKLLAVSAFCAYGHVLAMLCLCAGIGVVQLSRLRSLGPTWGSRALRLLATPLPVMPGVVWCVFVYRYQTRASFSNWAEASFDGLDDPLWFKLRHVLDMSVGNVWDFSDNILLALSLLVCTILAFAGAPAPPPSSASERDDLRAMRALALFFALCYLVIPKVFIATWFIYERFPPLALACLVAALPLRLFPHRDELRASAAVFAALAAANTVRVFATMGDQRDASAIIDDMPAGRKLVTVTYDATTERISREVYVHLPALYTTRKRGEIAYTFTKFESMPVHYRKGKAPPSVPGGFEWDGTKYDVRAAWARAYDLTLVRTTRELEDPTAHVFRGDAGRVRLLSRRGRFFLYDTTLLSLAPGPAVGEEPLRILRLRATVRGRYDPTFRRVRAEPQSGGARCALFFHPHAHRRGGGGGPSVFRTRGARRRREPAERALRDVRSRGAGERDVGGRGRALRRHHGPGKGLPQLRRGEGRVRPVGRDGARRRAG